METPGSSRIDDFVRKYGPYAPAAVTWDMIQYVWHTRSEQRTYHRPIDRFTSLAPSWIFPLASQARAYAIKVVRINGFRLAQKECFIRQCQSQLLGFVCDDFQSSSSVSLGALVVGNKPVHPRWTGGPVHVHT